jgi:hypothetical protein
MLLLPLFLFFAIADRLHFVIGQRLFNLRPAKTVGLSRKPNDWDSSCLYQELNHSFCNVEPVSEFFLR